jgi:integrase
MTRIKRLTQREAERAMPTETRVPVPEAAARVMQAVRKSPTAPTATIKRTTKWICDGAGLWLVISPGDTPDVVHRSWIFRWNVPGQVVVSKSGKARRLQRVMGLGSLHTVSLERARELAEICRRNLQEGRDPLLLKRGRAAATKIEERGLRPLKSAVDEYARLHGGAWTPLHARNWRRSFRHIDSIMDLPVSKIDRTMIVEALRPVWDRAPDTGQRLRGRLEQVLGASMAWGWRDRTDNPAAWKGGLEFSFRPRAQLQPPKRHDALPYVDASEFMKKLRDIDGERARGLELLIRTAVRTGEITTATGEAFDLDAATWAVPAEQTKTGKKTGEPHVVPLSDAAVACLRKLEVVPGKRVFDFHDRALYRLHKEIDTRGSVHGWRATFSTFCGDQGFPREVTERALDHLIGNASEQSYNRSRMLDLRRNQMDAWSDFLDGKVVADNVVQIAGRGK